MGAVTAHEIARQLVAEGEEVEDLILIDPPENPALFASVYNRKHEFEVVPEERMTLRRRISQGSVLLFVNLLRFFALPVPHRIRPRLVVAAYFRAARRYKIPAPAVFPIIVRRASRSNTSIWTRTSDIAALHQIPCSHNDFYRDDATMRRWTGALTKILEGR